MSIYAEPGAVRRGVGRLHEIGVPVLPVVTRGAARVGPMTGRLRWFPRLWRKVTITIDPPLPAELSADEALSVLDKRFADT
jgi:hypothetical protein